MKRLLPLMLAVVLMLSACHNDPVDRTAIDNMVAELDSVKTLYDGGDYLGAAKAFDALRNGYDSSAQMNYKTALEYRNRVLLPMFEWMGLPGGTGHIIDWCIPWSSIYDESQWKKRDRDYQVDLIRWNVDRTLEVMFRNSLYQYYREQEDAGRDVGLLEELPYVHDKTWKEFTRTLCMKYRIDRADVTFKGGEETDGGEP